MLDTHARKYVQPIIHHSAKRLLRAGLTANQVTVLAFIIGSSSGFFVYIGQPFWALAVLWLSGYLDAVDGTMARLTKPSGFGTVLDITFDRVVEISVIVGLAFAFPDARLALLLLSVSIILSMTIFLTVGAVSEKQGVKTFYYQAGLAERTEGFILFSLMILLTDHLILITYLFFAIELFTAMQRLREAKTILK
ncbi:MULTISPECIES: CDP-alcohol phosphatidyltransferase family protein [Metabacillus]|uniref:CDP-alcohol phosphatidyltransferase n=1 Tax=Metabacillus indicus TaxID=246786 RepID=A0A084H2X4_METID|nr:MULTISPECIES: CDP-alcohol phosphatidyltransferase family protein [Metabacillus]KEZ52724.1 CDP-alcohol phosphatidyltransferase [Metabacillus indicus LMG 22858]KEZ53936.1 CDP-alcohol phosphatidyltransferase [Metabacillus indicus]